MPVQEIEAAPASRAERRRQTRQLILDAARELFAERGYIETTIRAIAQRADVDPALVMQHFGTKSALFDEVAGIPETLDDALEGPPEELGERLLRHAMADVDRKEDRTMPVLRSMLTHPEAAHAVRCAIMNPETSPWTRVLVGPDADRRSVLIGTLVLGVLIARYMVHLPGVADAPAERLVELLGPCLRPLVMGEGDSAPTGAAPGSALDALAEADAARRAAAARVDECARAALAAGASYGDVGRLVGITRQAVRKRWPQGGDAETE
ncbi:putative transcriptional regulator, TetR family [Nocardia nova SH22a]|uniref:Putative transcriptional regulator, TetR family n=1 Tax=Nocardia nova SH22a TaxID=1415166 RepID=W5TAW8_9NOCA|nr:TetR family transcriptional regulator [Nocardia nova]AHH16342.1 putative transcriptional regulator, TetR family [Nocardia nova SH22a]